MADPDKSSPYIPVPSAQADVAAVLPPPSPSTGIMARLRNYFLTGLVLTGPIYITANLTWWFINWVDQIVRPIIPEAFRPETYLPFYVPGYGLIIALVVLTLLGFLTANLVGRKLVEFGEEILHRMPIIRPVYKSLKQIFETFFSKSGSSFRKVGLVEFPSPGMWSLVFVSQPPTPELSANLPDIEHVSVFMPCTPNPTTGFFFYLPKRDVVEINIPVEQAMTVIMSAGMVQPVGHEPQKKLSALAEAARSARASRAMRNTAAPAE